MPRETTPSRWQPNIRRILSHTLASLASGSHIFKVDIVTKWITVAGLSKIDDTQSEGMPSRK